MEDEEAKELTKLSENAMAPEWGYLEEASALIKSVRGLNRQKIETMIYVTEATVRGKAIKTALAEDAAPAAYQSYMTWRRDIPGYARAIDRLIEIGLQWHADRALIQAQRAQSNLLMLSPYAVTVLGNSMRSDNERVSLDAAKSVLDRVKGLAKIAEVSMNRDKDDNPYQGYDFNRLTDEQKQAYLELLSLMEVKGGSDGEDD